LKRIKEITKENTGLPWPKEKEQKDKQLSTTNYTENIKYSNSESTKFHQFQQDC
jgi:hypothetical protein